MNVMTCVRHLCVAPLLAVTPRQRRGRHLHDNHPDVVEMILKCHTKAYLDHVMSFKDDGGIVGEEAHCAAPHGVDIILKSASGALECVDQVNSCVTRHGVARSIILIMFVKNKHTNIYDKC